MFGLSSRLRRVVAAYTINQFGNWFGYIALAVVVYDHTHSAIAVAALLATAQAIPALFVPAMVAHVERSPRRGWLTALYSGEAIIVAALAVVVQHFWLPAVLALAALDGLAALTARALVRAAASRIGAEDASTGIPEVDAASASALGARRANSALNAGFTVTMAIGPALAGLFVAAAGGPAALIVDAATFLVCGSLVQDVATFVKADRGPAPRWRLTVGLEQFRAVPHLRALLRTEALALLAFESAAPVEVLYAKASLHAGDRGYGLLMAVWGLGQIVGSIVFARWAGRSLRPLLIGGTIAVGLAYLGFGAAPSLAVACGAASVGGVGNGVQWAAFISAAQELTPADLHGRLMGAIESIGAIVPALAFSLGGILAALTSPRSEFWVAGAMATAITILFVRVTAGLASPLDAARPDSERNPAPTDAPEGLAVEPVGA